jgi:hypothetical protein
MGMDSDLKAADLKLIADLGQDLMPPGGEPPADLRRRVLGAAINRRRSAGHGIGWRGAIFAAGLAAVIAFVMLANPSAGPVAPPSSGVAAQNPAQLLELAAHRVAVAGNPVVRPGQYIYTESVAIYQDIRLDGRPTVFSQKMLVRQWRPADDVGNGLVQTRQWDTPEAAWKSSSLPGCRERRDCPADSSALDDLPTDAQAMYEYLYRPVAQEFAAGMNADERALSQAAYVLYEGQYSSAVQAAVFEAMKRIPGVTLRFGVADVMGRTGVALAYGGTTSTELIFDPVSYQYLGVNRKLMWITMPRDPERAQLTIRMAAQEALLRVAIVDKIGDQ